MGGSVLADEIVAGVEHSLTRLVRQATRPTVDRWVSAVSGITLDRANYVALVRIDEVEPVRPTDLADILGVDLSTVSRQVRDLVAASLVERSGDPVDQRACRLRLTVEGRAVLARVRSARQEAMRQLLARWSDQDKRRLAVLIKRLADDMEALTQADLLPGLSALPLKDLLSPGPGR